MGLEQIFAPIPFFLLFNQRQLVLLFFPILLQYKDKKQLPSFLLISLAAAAGGYTTVVCMANTKPVADKEEIINYVMEEGEKTGITVLTVGCITSPCLFGQCYISFYHLPLCP